MIISDYKLKTMVYSVSLLICFIFNEKYVSKKDICHISVVFIIVIVKCSEEKLQDYSLLD